MGDLDCVCVTKDGRFFPCKAHERRHPERLNPDTAENFKLWLERAVLWFDEEKVMCLEIISMIEKHDPKLAQLGHDNFVAYEACIVRKRELLEEMKAKR